MSIPGLVTGIKNDITKNGRISLIDTAKAGIDRYSRQPFLAIGDLLGYGPLLPLAAVSSTFRRQYEAQQPIMGMLGGFRFTKGSIGKYDRAQNLIDLEESRLAKRGVDTVKMFDPKSPEAKLLHDAEGWNPMPDRLAKLYRIRDSAQIADDSANVADLTKQIETIVGKDRAASLANKIIEVDILPASRGVNQREGWRDIGRVADVVLNDVISKKQPSAAATVRAVLSGTPEQPGIQLVTETYRGFEPPSMETLKEAQLILNEVMGVSAPTYLIARIGLP